MATELQTYKSPRFINKVVLADIEFVPLLEVIDQFAADNGLTIFVTSSARLDGAFVPGAIVKPASRSNHLVGHGIDMNIKMGSQFFNSTRLAKPKLKQLPSPVQAFIESIRNHPVLRWGGDFNTPDPVHIDDELNIRSPSIWDKKYKIIQSQLAGLTQPGLGADGKKLLLLTSPRIEGDDVKAVQQKLIDLGFDVGPSGADGVFGVATAKAVTEFQTQEKLQTVDGIVGSETREKLGL